jgi:hypothetical protein
MEMVNLRALHQSMLRLGVDMQQFGYNVNRAEFDCLFVANQRPHLLCLTVRGQLPLYLKFEVDPDTFIIANRIPEDAYPGLSRLLRTHGTSWSPLKPSEFLEGLDARVPTVAAHRTVPPEEVIRLRADITEERERPHFDTWIYWENREGPSEENKAKTLALIGDEALQHSIEFRCSSRWSATQTLRTWHDARQR